MRLRHPKPKNRGKAAKKETTDMFAPRQGINVEGQDYDSTHIINDIHAQIVTWVD
ncbi:MAG: hypothetical protein R3F19_23105 [Verrucomicrobiales bacterium]